MISESGGGQAPPLPVSILFKLRRLRDRRMARPVGIDSGSNRVLREAVTSSVVSARTTAASVIRHENGKGGERMMAGEWEEPERLNRRRPDHEADTIAGPERFRRSGGHRGRPRDVGNDFANTFGRGVRNGGIRMIALIFGKRVRPSGTEVKDGEQEGIRTPGLQLRRLLPYPD